MTGSIGFHRDRACASCGVAESRSTLVPTALPLFGSVGDLCAGCRQALLDDASQAWPFVLELPLDTELRWVGHGVGDAHFFSSLVRERIDAPALRHEDDDPVGMLEASRAAIARLRAPESTAPRGLPSPRQRSSDRGAAAGGPTRSSLAAALAIGMWSAAVAQRELMPLDELRMLIGRAAASDELRKLFGTYALLLANVKPDPASGARLSDAQRELLDAAREAYYLSSSTTLESEADGRMAVLRVVLSIAESRLDDARRLLEPALQQAERNPRARDPRLPFLEALLAAEPGAARRIDRALEKTRAWLAQMPQTPERVEVAANLAHNQFARAIASDRVDDARAALEDYCRLRPRDRRGRLMLAHLGQRSGATDDAAAHFIETCYLEDRADHDAAMLHAAYLHRVGRSTEALEVVTRLLDDGDPVRSVDPAHLGGLCALEIGDRRRARQLLERALRGSPGSRAISHGLWHVVRQDWLDAARARVPAAELVGLVEAQRELLLTHFGRLHLWAATWFVARELSKEGAGAPTLGLTPRELEDRLGSSVGSIIQSYELLARRNLRLALEKSAAGRQSGSAPVPFALLGELLEYARTWTPLDREMVLSSLERAFRALTPRA